MRRRCPGRPAPPERTPFRRHLSLLAPASPPCIDRGQPRRIGACRPRNDHVAGTLHHLCHRLPRHHPGARTDRDADHRQQHPPWLARRPRQCRRHAGRPGDHDRHCRHRPHLADRRHGPLVRMGAADRRRLPDLDGRADVPLQRQAERRRNGRSRAAASSCRACWWRSATPRRWSSSAPSSRSSSRRPATMRCRSSSWASPR